MDENGMEEQDVYPVGPYTAWATPDGMRAVIKNNGHEESVFKGETAWSDAARVAGDSNSAIKRGQRA